MKAQHVIRYAAFILRESVKSFLHNSDFQKAATLAYYCFLAFVPLCLLVVVLLGALLSSSEIALENLRAMMEQSFPMAAGPLLKELDAVIRNRTWGLLGFLALFWCIMPLAGALRNALSELFKFERRMPFWKSKLKEISGVLVLVALFSILSVAGLILPFPHAWLTKFPFLRRALMTGLFLALTLGSLWLFFRILAPVRIGGGALAAGSIATALLLSMVGPFFGLMLRVNPNYGVTFGSLKGIFLMLVWVYYSFAALLFGMEVMANTWRREALLFKELLSRPAKALKSGSLLRSFIQSRDQGETIFQEGDAGGDMFYIVSGKVALFKGDRLLRTLGPGEHFGEMAMLLDAPRTATARAAARETKLAAIARPNFEIVMAENPGIAAAILREMAARLKATTDNMGKP